MGSIKTKLVSGILAAVLALGASAGTMLSVNAASDSSTVAAESVENIKTELFVAHIFKYDGSYGSVEIDSTIPAIEVNKTLYLTDFFVAGGGIRIDENDEYKCKVLIYDEDTGKLLRSYTCNNQVAINVKENALEAKLGLKVKLKFIKDNKALTGYVHIRKVVNNIDKDLSELFKEDATVDEEGNYKREVSFYPVSLYKHAGFVSKGSYITDGNNKIEQKNYSIQTGKYNVYVNGTEDILIYGRIKSVKVEKISAYSKELTYSKEYEKPKFNAIVPLDCTEVGTYCFKISFTNVNGDTFYGYTDAYVVRDRVDFNNEDDKVFEMGENTIYTTYDGKQRYSKDNKVAFIEYDTETIDQYFSDFAGDEETIYYETMSEYYSGKNKWKKLEVDGEYIRLKAGKYAFKVVYSYEKDFQYETGLCSNTTLTWKNVIIKKMGGSINVYNSLINNFGQDYVYNTYGKAYNKLLNALLSGNYFRYIPMSLSINNDLNSISSVKKENITLPTNNGNIFDINVFDGNTIINTNKKIRVLNFTGDFTFIGGFVICNETLNNIKDSKAYINMGDGKGYVELTGKDVPLGIYNIKYVTTFGEKSVTTKLLGIPFYQEKA